MAAAKYVGRVGGLAVALGVGSAVVLGGQALGTPLASAAPGSGEASSESASAPATHKGPVKDRQSARSLRQAAVRAATKDRAAKLGESGRHRVSATTPKSDVAQSITDRLSEAQSKVDARLTRHRNGSSEPDTAGTDVSPTPEAAKPQASPKAVESPVDVPDAEPEAIATAKTVQAAPAPARNLIETVVNDIARTLAGNSPAAPATDSPAEWVLLAAARREFATAAVSPSLSGTGGITAAPSVGITDGIIHGTTGATSTGGLPLTYTVIGDPSAGGKVRLDSADGTFTFLPYATVVDSGGAEKFTVLVAETTAFDAALQQIPIVGSFVPQMLVIVHQMPVVSDLLAPLIGEAEVVDVNVDVGALAPAGTPVAYTVNVTSFDGTPISMNWFPASGLQAGDEAPTIFSGAGLSSAGDTDPYTGGPTGVGTFRDNGYNVVTWDSRGEHASGGLLQLDNPFFEGRDASAMIDYVAKRPFTQLDGANDPRMGMVGGSYGGGIQWVTAATDNRVDAIVPTISWNSLNSSLYPNEAFKTSYAALLLLSLVTSGANINNQLYGGIFTGALLGVLTPEQQALLASSGPTALVNKVTAPTLIIQGTVDVLFPLQQAIDNATILDANGVPVKMVWFCGGHGNCETPPGDSAEMVQTATLSWLDSYVKHKGEEVDDGLPKFQWIDQNGDHYTSDLLPSDPGFTGTPVNASGDGGLLGIVPILGGSGPGAAGIPFGLGDGTKATNAVNTTVTAPSGTATQIVGAPELTMTYSGIGTSRHVYAQIVDDQTGQVIGNVVTPIPVTLDGREHTVTIPMEAVAYTLEPGHTATVQITSSATPFLNVTQFGVINISGVQVVFPTVGAGANAQPAADAAEDLVSV
ncbi:MULTISPECIES: S15 peptidase family protein [Mycolicibacterium]|uniref:S15 peptidase family protein n=1 Tax=Mycolicibacterium TaxID=1866885 RepID=UPI00056A1099|nr:MULTISPECIES: CocE/NonD family hydrolase [Mycolicibacterium]MCV7338711.1 peptidase S15 [Mycolicibacterium senegalense]MDR7289582.1 ABC-2 type transport system ATP-binding protein [Mycolicibacterium senegalense]QZA26408.1 peptidase S15 [Mycolicibacterium senegalense]